MLRFAEELLILTIDAENRDPVHLPDRTLNYGLAGAVLMDLELEGRIDTDMAALYVTNSVPVGDSLLDPVLAEIVEEPDTLPTESWIARLAGRGSDLRTLALERLMAAGILEVDDGGIFSISRWVARSGRYPTIDGMREQEIQSRMMGLLLSDEVPSPRDSVIVSLAHACGVFRRLLAPSEYEELEERIELISKLELVTRAAAAAIRNVSLAESRRLQRVVRERGGGWPKASGRLPVVGHALKLAGDLHAFCTEQYLEHGPVFEASAFGNTYVVMAGREANVFMSREGRSHLRTRETWQRFSDMVGTSKLLIGLDGADHRLLRRTKSRGYSRKFILERMPEVVAVMERELAALPFDRPHAVFPLMQRVMVEQITLLAAGTSCRDHLDDLIKFNDAMIRVAFQRYPKFLLGMPGVNRARRRLEKLIERVLAAHESKPRGANSPDLVDDLIELHRSAPDFLPETDMFINPMGPFMVGLDTVASVTSFCVYALLKHPDLADRARVEADDLFATGDPTVEGIQRMTTTRGVIFESLRMFPIVQALSRTVTNTFEFAGYHIPAGTQVLIAITVPHHLPEFFPNPERFDIDRYSPERREHLRRGVYSPFGLGHHTCMGRLFAEVQMILTLGALLHRAEIALEPRGYRLRTIYKPGARPEDRFKIRLRQRR
jgi:cytochrome P450